MKLYFYVLLVTLTISWANGHVATRLFGGPSSTEGFVAVEYKNQWGTVCDDEFQENNIGCQVVCSSLHYAGGVVVPLSERNRYTPNTEYPIWLDEVVCQGWEANIDSCNHYFWGDHDCKHEEDVACICDDSQPQNDEDHVTGSGFCDILSHRITPLDPAYPGIGRAEVKDDKGVWHGICDDHWDDNDAIVFCKCLGYPDESHFRAFWSNDINNLPELALLYDAVKCSSDDARLNQNIWDCEIEPNSGRCDLNEEAAAVACQELPHVHPQHIPEAEVTCDGHTLEACFSNAGGTLQPAYLHLSPTCSHNSVYVAVDNVCMTIHMDSCSPSQETTDISAKHYCFDVIYAEPSSYPLLLLSYWKRTACCSVAKNGTVMSNFEPKVADMPAVYTETAAKFDMACFLQDNFEGQPIAFPANITQGEELFCQITTDAWDPKFWLIVPDCKFMATASGTPYFHLIEDKCPTSGDFGLTYYSFGAHGWGFKVLVPKFEGFEELYLFCNCYVCDYTQEGKPYCDRTCRQNGNSRGKRSLRENIGRGVAGGPFNIITGNMGPFIALKHQETGHIIDQAVKELDAQGLSKAAIPIVGLAVPFVIFLWLLVF